MQQNIKDYIDGWTRVYPELPDISERWLTYRMRVVNGWLYKTVDMFHVTDRDGIISMTDWKVTVTFVPG